jgi:hypothetical protein
MTEITNQDLKELILSLDKKMELSFATLTAEIRRVDEKHSAEIKRVDEKLSTQIRQVEQIP